MVTSMTFSKPFRSGSAIAGHDLLGSPKYHFIYSQPQNRTISSVVQIGLRPLWNATQFIVAAPQVVIMRFSSLIVTALAAVCVIANPLPSGLASDGVVEVKKVSDGDLSTMVTDHIPTTEELKKHMHTQAEMRNTSLFYSGPHGYRPKALELAKKIGRHILTDFFLDPYYAASWPDNNTEFWNHASEAMAQLSSETVYVLLPSDTVGQVWYPNTFWDRIEWPTLIKNPAVDYVVRVNPDNDKHEVIYQAHRY